MNFLFNNAMAGRGWLDSMSATRRSHGDRLVTFGDIYPLAGAETEAIWEQVRAQHFPRKPSRLGALFLFDRRELSEANAAKWRPDLDVVVLRARTPRATCIHRGHTGWFGAFSAPPEQVAARYWNGEPCSGLPGSWEYVVDGAVYFPDWQAPHSLPPASGRAPTHTVLGCTEVVVCPVCGIEFVAGPPKTATLTTAEERDAKRTPTFP